MKSSLKDIADTWYFLLEKKKIYARIVYSRITKVEQISPKDPRWPEISESIKKNGYYDVSIDISGVRKNGLHDLVTLGYVEKREKDTVYHISCMYVMHPYHPVIFPSGGLAITAGTRDHLENVTLDSRMYSLFEESASKFKEQIAEGRHPHITQFEYSVNFCYESDVYEVKDTYFDALFLTYDPSTNKLIVKIVEPYTEQTITKKVRKRWEPIKLIDAELFLNGSGNIASEIASLPWKQRYIGIIIHNNKGYILGAVQAQKEKEPGNEDFSRMPDFLNEKIYSHPGMRSTRFEEVVKNYLIDKHDYPYAKSRYRPKYSQSFELDVYAEKEVAGQKEIIICECKFRQPKSKQAVKKDELNKFKIKKQKVEQNEQSRGKITLNSWLVTNGDRFEEGFKEEAMSAGIKIMKAKLSSGWEKRSDWKVTEIEEFK